MLALMLCASAGGAWAQSAPTSTEATLEQAAREAAAQERTRSPESNDAAVVDTVEVTGSRLRNGNPTASVIVITEEEIKARGVSSVEDLIRTLPQNVATIGAITNERGRGPLMARNAPVTAIGALGVSAANLGGMGAGNTLVLVNGRRIAGAAGIEDGFVNLNGIPLSAVERVEITMSGASAIYGADATGGVINFVLKSNFTGTTVTAQHEYSSNDADTDRISAFSGYSWGSGSVSGTLSYSRRMPINNYKSGYFTEDYSGYYDGDTAFDTRSFSRGLQPGVIDTTYYVYDENFNSTRVTQGLTVRPGFTGAPTMADMITVGAEALPDYVPELAGPETESYSGTFNFQQKLTNKLSVFVDGLYNRSTNAQELLYDTGLRLDLAPGQAYNPFPAYYFNTYSPGATVNYSPAAEIAAGELPVGKVSNTSSNWSINAGATYQFNADTKLEVTYTTSQSDTDGQLPRLASVVSLIADATSPNGVRCDNFDLRENRVTGAARDYLQSVFDRQCLALTSSDPTLAINPWKSVAGGPGASVADFFYTPVTEERQSRSANWQARLNGVLYTLPAGKIYYAVGGELYDDGVESSEVSYRTTTSGSRDRYAYFGEMNLPIFGGDFSFPGMRSLMVSLAARYDSYTTEGPIGTVDGIPADAGGVLIIAENTFARTTPAYGVRWEPFEGLSFRGRWTEGFQAPPFTQLFTAVGGTSYTTTIYNDPLYQCTTDCAYTWSPNSYNVVMRTTSNPDLQPQTSTQSSYGMTWRPKGRLDGLMLDINYNRTKIDNEFARTNDLQTFLTQAQILQLEQFYPRDPVTHKILEARSMTFNILGSEYASINYDLSYLWVTSRGTFEPKISYLDNLNAERRAFADVPAASTLGYLQGPDDYKIIGSLGWYYHDINAMLWANYIPSYTNNYEVNQYSGVIANLERYKPVDASLTIDLTAAWRISNDVRLNFAGRNIFDADPPFVVVQGRPYDTGRYNAAGRTLSLELQYSF
jgi:iron complex outermembrane receptor protein